MYCTCPTPALTLRVSVHDRTNPIYIYMSCTENERRMKLCNLNDTALRFLEHWHHTQWEKIPGCIALVIFSSNRTGYHPRSQNCWGGFVLHSEQIWIRLGKLTRRLLRRMNINVTSDRGERHTGKYRFITRTEVGQTTSLWPYLTPLFVREPERSLVTVEASSPISKLTPDKHDRAERDVTSEQ